jgi:hypothetical protein
LNLPAAFLKLNKFDEAMHERKEKIEEISLVSTPDDLMSNNII